MTRERARFHADTWPGWLSLPRGEREEIVTRCILAAVAEATAEERERCEKIARTAIRDERARRIHRDDVALTVADRIADDAAKGGG